MENKNEAVYINNCVLYNADCFDVFSLIEDDSVDAIVTDPPYELGFMGKKWDSTGIAYSVELWAECLRVLKPGGHLLAFSGTRTYHRMACAIEDAGFEIRDSLVWVYNSGFPKSLNIGKAYDKLHGNEMEQLGDGQYTSRRQRPMAETNIPSAEYGFGAGHKLTKNNSQWEGFGTALKPANEPICMARKPLSEKTIVENVLKHGTGALDIDGCRIPTQTPIQPRHLSKPRRDDNTKYGKSNTNINPPSDLGRFPANVLCTDDALNDGVLSTTKGARAAKSKGNKTVFNGGDKHLTGERIEYDAGSKSRYFDIDVWAEKHGILQFPKASKSDRGSGNTHPTVKPVHLMAWLVRLVSKDGDTVLDPFAGSGTTGLACLNTNRKFIGIEKEKEYFDIAVNRLKTVQARLF